jgi:hypothetical protein
VIARRLCRHRLQSEVGKTVKKIVAIAALAVALAGAGGAAQAADFVYAQGTGQRSLGISTYDPLGQTFTAGTETELSSFGFQLRLSNVNAANDPITFTLLQGAGFGGTQVATRALSVSGRLRSDRHHTRRGGVLYSTPQHDLDTLCFGFRSQHGIVSVARTSGCRLYRHLHRRTADRDRLQ